MKQEQLTELAEVLTHDKYTATGLNSDVGKECASLKDYINESNTTAWKEKTELDQHLREVDESESKMDTWPCPCV